MTRQTRLAVCGMLIVCVLAVLGGYRLVQEDFFKGRGFEEFKNPAGIFECQFPKGWKNRPAVYSRTPQAVFMAPAPRDEAVAAVPSM